MAKKELFAAVKAYYESQGWHYEVREDKDRIEMLITLKDFNTCRVITRVHDERFVTYCVFPVRVPEAARARAGEYLHRANYGLNIGNFEFDYNDGEVRYKSNIQCGEAIPAMRVIEQLVDVGMDMVIRYGNGLMKVIYGGADPKQAIHEVEDKPVGELPPELEALLREELGAGNFGEETARQMERFLHDLEASGLTQMSADGDDEDVLRRLECLEQATLEQAEEEKAHEAEAEDEEEPDGISEEQLARWKEQLREALTAADDSTLDVGTLAAAWTEYGDDVMLRLVKEIQQQESVSNEEMLERMRNLIEKMTEKLCKDEAEESEQDEAE